MANREVTCSDCGKKFRHVLRRGRPPKFCTRCRTHKPWFVQNEVKKRKKQEMQEKQEAAEAEGQTAINGETPQEVE